MGKYLCNRGNFPLASNGIEYYYLFLSYLHELLHLFLQKIMTFSTMKIPRRLFSFLTISTSKERTWAWLQQFLIPAGWARLLSSPPPLIPQSHLHEHAPNASLQSRLRLNSCTEPRLSKSKRIPAQKVPHLAIITLFKYILIQCTCWKIVWPFLHFVFSIHQPLRRISLTT